MWRYIAVGLISVVLASCASTIRMEKKAETKKLIVGYLFEGNDTVDPDSLNLGMVTDVIYAFAKIESDTITEGFRSSARNLRILNKAKRKHPGLRILISVGGWGWSGGFSDMCLTADSRAKFIASAVRFVSKYNLDGIDIDWEYPGLRGAGNVHRPEDKQNFTSLLAGLRMALDSLGMKTGKYYLMSAAAGAFGEYLMHTDIAADAKYLDFINLMTYDMSIPGADSLAGLNAPLFADPRDPDRNSADAAVAAFEAAGVPPSKIVLGVPFYGRAWHVDTSAFNGLYEPGGRPGTRMNTTYKGLVENYIDKNGFESYWDSTSCAPYLFNRDSDTFISYEDPRSLRDKCYYVKARGLGGVMFWSFKSDYESTLLRTLFEELR